MYEIVNTYIYMYFCHMTNKQKFLQFSVRTDESCRKRYIVIVEIVENEDPILHIIPLPDWLVFNSEKYHYNCINLD